VLCADLFIANPNPLDRRSGQDRRERPLHGLLAGHWLRRRRAERRSDDGHPAGLDWHDAHWLGVAVSVLMLCIADAFLTLTLIRQGAEEVNPLMAPLISGGGPGFAYWKLGLTTFGVVVLTILARVRLFGVVPAGCVLYLILVGYVCLVAYEWQLLHHVGTEFISYWGPVPLQLVT
jgi:hypothetical protein